jgi:hypothetical protein
MAKLIAYVIDGHTVEAHSPLNREVFHLERISIRNALLGGQKPPNTVYADGRTVLILLRATLSGASAISKKTDHTPRSI